MNKGRRVLGFWIYVFVASGTGCSGCFDFGGNSQGCNADICDGGDCFSFGEGDGSYVTSDASPPPSDRYAIARNIMNPAGTVSDGTNVFYIDGQTLYAAFRNVDSPTPLEVADGVRPVGGLVVDDTYIYWASAELASDGGPEDDAGGDADSDAGDDAGDAGDAGDDAGDAGDDAGTLPTRGVFRVLKTGGAIEFLGDLDPLPGIALANGNLFLQARGDDAGVFGLLAIDGGAGFQPLGAVSENATTTRSIALVGSGVAHLDRPDIDFSDLVDGGSSTLVSDANASALVATSTAAFYITRFGTGSVLRSTSADSGVAIAFDVGDVAAYGNYVYIADDSANALYRFDSADPAVVLTVENDGVPIQMLAADDSGVCWIEGAPARALFCSRAP